MHIDYGLYKNFAYFTSTIKIVSYKNDYHFVGSCGYVGLRIVWDQRTQSLFAGGDARVIRVWDAESELKLSDITTGTDSFVNSLSVDHDGK